MTPTGGQRQLPVATALMAIALACGTPTASRADAASDARISYLEQQVRELRIQLLQASRRMDALERGMTGSRTDAMPQAPRTEPATASTGTKKAWLDSGHWDKLRPGMSEAEVLDALGAPTTSRTTGNGGTRTLFYSLELEAGGFLSGRVIISDGRVVEIHKPELR